MGSAGREVEHPATNERAAVVDGDDDGTATMAHAELGAEGQRAVGTGHGVLVEALARGGLPAGFIAVHRGNSGEAASRPHRRRHGRIGVTPGISVGFGGAADVVKVVAVVMPGFGRCLGGGSTDQQSCGKKSERYVRAG